VNSATDIEMRLDQALPLDWDPSSDTGQAIGLLTRAIAAEIARVAALTLDAVDAATTARAIRVVLTRAEAEALLAACDARRVRTFNSALHAAADFDRARDIIEEALR